MNKTGVYKIVNKINGKVYYGSTEVSFDNRWKCHKNELNANTHDNKYLQNTWNKYGQDSFLFSIILECYPKECLMYEQMCLDLYWDDNINCYNICPVAGNSSGRKVSSETIAKMSKAHSNQSIETREKISKAVAGINNPFYGKLHTPETIKKMKTARTGTKISVEVRNKMSNARKGQGNANAKLNLTNVREIRDKYNSGQYKQTVLAKEYGVTPANICDIVNNKIWIQ